MPLRCKGREEQYCVVSAYRFVGAAFMPPTIPGAQRAR